MQAGRLDTRLAVETPGGVELALHPAGAPARGLAFAVDFGLRIVLFVIAATLLRSFEGIGGGLLLLLFFGIEWFYPVLFELLPGAATPGKRMLGLRVVMDDGMPVTPAASLLRNLLRTADFLPMMYVAGAISMLSRSDFRRLGDIVAGTLVVHVPTALRREQPAAAEPAAPPMPLSGAQQTAVVDWALRAPRLTAARAEELAMLALPALPAGPGSPTERLLAVAHWTLGRR
jgi:uncharacterized RDD family membrane protein YckC